MSVLTNVLKEKKWLFMILILCTVNLFVYILSIDSLYVSAQHERQSQTSGIALNIVKKGIASFWQPQVDFPMGRKSLENLNNEIPDITIVRYEVPFHGILNWPISLLVGWKSWTPSLISFGASLITIFLSWGFFSKFFESRSSFFGILILSTSPLFLHFGQVPMPDILSLMFLTCSLFFAAPSNLKGQDNYNPSSYPNRKVKSLLLSASFFALGILAKQSLAPFLLSPALLLSSKEKTGRRIVTIFIYSIVAILPLLIWAGLSVFDNPLYSTNFIEMAKDPSHKGFPQDLFTINFYLRSFAYISIFGVGFLGILLALYSLLALLKNRKYDFLLGAILGCLYLYINTPRLMWREPQYSLVVVFWLSFLASAGFQLLLNKLGSFGGFSRKILKYSLLLLFVVQLFTVTAGTLDLKASRIPNASELVEAGKLLPPEAKVIQISPSYGATPTFLLNRKTILLENSSISALDHYTKSGYKYILFWNYTLRSGFSGNRKTIIASEKYPELFDFCKNNFKSMFIDNGVHLFEINY
jgi:hypothetical protein